MNLSSDGASARHPRLSFGNDDKKNGNDDDSSSSSSSRSSSSSSSSLLLLLVVVGELLLLLGLDAAMGDDGARCHDISHHVIA